MNSVLTRVQQQTNKCFVKTDISVCPRAIQNVRAFLPLQNAAVSKIISHRYIQLQVSSYYFFASKAEYMLQLAKCLYIHTVGWSLTQSMWMHGTVYVSAKFKCQVRLFQSLVPKDMADKSQGKSWKANDEPIFKERSLSFFFFFSIEEIPSLLNLL